MIATRDIARSAAALLTAREENGRAVRELLGPRDLSMNEAAGIIGAAIGRPDVPYVPFSDEEMAAALGEAGLSDEFIGLHLETTRALNDKTIQAREVRTTENTTPTRFEEFAADLARAYEAL